MLPFAKRGDDRGNNLIRLQQMFPRIVAAEFQQPLHVSKDCQTLLSRMLTPNPAKRITIGEIMQHPWCVSSPPGTRACVRLHVLSLHAGRGMCMFLHEIMQHP